MKQQEVCEYHATGDSAEESHKQCISIVPIFNHLDPHELTEIVSTAKSLIVERGEMVYRAGEKSTGLYILHKGRVKIYRLSESGREQLVRILEPGSFTGELALFSDKVHDAHAEAMIHSELCVMDRTILQQFLVKFPAISLKVLAEFASRLDQSEKQAARFAMESVETRLALYLAELTEEAKSEQVKLPMSRKDLASFLGTTPETISRKLAEFETAGWIIQSGQRKLQIADLDALLLL